MIKGKADLDMTIIPMSNRVLIRKDEDRTVTKGGLLLPGQIKIPVITARIVALSANIENDPLIDLRLYDKVLVEPSDAIPVDFESDNKLFIVRLEQIVAVFRKKEAEAKEPEA